MNKWRVRIAVVCTAIALACGLLVWLFCSAPAGGRDGVAISFVGYTKVTGTTMGQFMLTNFCSVPIGVMAGPAQVKASNSWPDVSLTTNYGAAIILDPGQSSLFLAAPPLSNNLAWRVPVFYFKRKSALGWSIEKHRDLLGMPRLRIPEIQVRFCPTNSPEVTGFPDSSVR